VKEHCVSALVRLKPVSRWLDDYFRTLMMPTTIILLVIHFLEDSMLITIGAFMPVPFWGKLVIGGVLSWTLFGLVMKRMLGKHVH